MPELYARAGKSFEELGKADWQAASLAVLANLAWAQGEYAMAEAQALQSAHLFDRAGETTRAAYALEQAASSQREQGRFAQAEALFKQCLHMFEVVGDQVGQGSVINGLGDLEFDRGDYEAAQTYYHQAEEIWRGTVPGLAQLALRGMARVACAQNRILEASDLIETCVAASRRWWSSNMPSLVHHLAFIRHLLGDGPVRARCCRKSCPNSSS